MVSFHTTDDILRITVNDGSSDHGEYHLHLGSKKIRRIGQFFWEHVGYDKEQISSISLKDVHGEEFNLTRHRDGHMTINITQDRHERKTIDVPPSIQRQLLSSFEGK